MAFFWLLTLSDLCYGVQMRNHLYLAYDVIFEYKQQECAAPKLIIPALVQAGHGCQAQRTISAKSADL